MVLDKEKTLKRLKNLFNSYRVASIATPVLAVASAILAYFRPVASVATAFCVALLYLFGLRRARKDYLNACTAANLAGTLCVTLGADTVDTKGGGAITKETIKQADLLPFDDTVSGCVMFQGISGVADNFPTAVCDATLMQSYIPEGGKARKIDFCTGAWMHITLPHDTGMNWRLLGKKALLPEVRKQRYNADSPLSEWELNEKWSDLRCYLAKGSNRPGNRLLAQVESLMQYTPGAVAVSLRGDTLDVFLRSRFVAYGFSHKAAPTMQIMEFDPLPELGYALKLAKLLCNPENSVAPDAPDAGNAPAETPALPE